MSQHVSSLGSSVQSMVKTNVLNKQLDGQRDEGRESMMNRGRLIEKEEWNLNIAGSNVKSIDVEVGTYHVRETKTVDGIKVDMQVMKN